MLGPMRSLDRGRWRSGGICAVIACACALLLATPAVAQESSVRVYGGEGGTVETAVGAAPATERPRAPLPLTGLTLGLLAGGGAALLGVGWGTRRWARDH